MAFAVVKFTSEEDGVGVIATNWISKFKNECYPNTTNEVMEKLLKKRANPTAEWKVYPIKVLKEYETYSDARLNLKKAEDTSNLDSDEESQGKRKRRVRLLDCGEETDEEIHYKKNHKVKKISSYPPLDSFFSQNTSNRQKSKGIDESNSSDDLDIHHSSTFLQAESLASPCHISTYINSTARNSELVETSFIPPPISTPVHSISESDNNKVAVALGHLTSTVADLVQVTKDVSRKLDILLGSAGPVNQHESFSGEIAMIGSLPLTTVEDFKTHEKKLQEAGYHNLLVKILISLGGRDCRTFTYNALRRLMTCELSTNFSFTGKKVKDNEIKQAFCSTLLYRSIQAAVKKAFPDSNEAAIRTNVSLWLQQAKHRLVRRNVQKNFEMDSQR